MEKDKKETDEDDKKSDKQEKKEGKKALFIQRLVAFIFDIFIISIVASLVSTPFVDVKKSDEYNKQATELMEKYMNQKIDVKEYSVKVEDISYKMARNNGFMTITTIVLEILYFVVFQIYNNGQTIGKKLMKIRVVSDNDGLSMNQMIFRSMIANSILVEIISFAFMIFASKKVYFYCSGTFEFIQYVIIFASLFMVMYRKDGCAVHDKLAHTKVITVE